MRTLVDVLILLAVAAFLAAITGCVAAPEGAYQIKPPQSYIDMWARTEACTGIHHDFRKVAVFIVPGRTFEMDGREAAGMERDGDIYIAEGFQTHPMIVRHEMVHALLASLWISGHPDHPFKHPCRATWDTWDYNEPRLVL